MLWLKSLIVFHDVYWQCMYLWSMVYCGYSGCQYIVVHVLAIHVHREGSPVQYPHWHIFVTLLSAVLLVWYYLNGFGLVPRLFLAQYTTYGDKLRDWAGLAHHVIHFGRRFRFKLIVFAVGSPFQTSSVSKDLQIVWLSICLMNDMCASILPFCFFSVSGNCLFASTTRSLPGIDHCPWMQWRFHWPTLQLWSRTPEESRSGWEGTGQ